mmetsp:Transcript_11917/g.21949  ORF Transcript_11917/g.21949 Transcript_11917/m.21949 type:complete len:201 (-) Transcript_11917:3022-3624(-)
MRTRTFIVHTSNYYFSSSTFSMMLRNAWYALPLVKGFPFSPAICNDWSIGTLPRNGTSNFSAIPLGPPPHRGNMLSSTSRSRSSGHFSAINFLIRSVSSLPALEVNFNVSTGIFMVAMFSTTPITGILVCLQKFNSLRTSIIATAYYIVRNTLNIPYHTNLPSWGVVTTTAPSFSLKDSFNSCTIEICSSDVPGGVSITR